MMRFEWDPKKEASNRAKHGIGFDEASAVFDDPFHLTRADIGLSGEERWQTIGVIDGVLILVVVYTQRDEDEEEYVRIISARRAEPFERRQYGNRSF
jgi:uncharacterized protein